MHQFGVQDRRAGGAANRIVSQRDEPGVHHRAFVDRSDAWLVENGFVEREIHRETRRFGNMAHVWSTYEWVTEDGATGRGINGIHLYHDGSRWWITHATWDAEREGAPIPAEYLP